MLNFFKKNKNIITDNGLNKIYSKNGKGDLISEFTRVNGVIDGEAIHYREDGSIKKIETYKSGQLNGLTKIYDSFGFVNEINYKNDNVVSSKKDIELKNKFESIKDFMLKTRLIDSEFKVDFLEISQMSDETIKSKSKELSESSKYDTEDIFYYLTYKRMFGIENFLNNSEENDFNKTVESLFKKVDESFKENLEHVISLMNEELTCFDENGVYNNNISGSIKSTFRKMLGESYWEDNYSSIRDIYEYSRYDWTSSNLSVDEYFNHLKNTTNELFSLKPRQYLDLKMLFYQANQVSIRNVDNMDKLIKDIHNNIKIIIDDNVNIKSNEIYNQSGKYYFDGWDKDFITEQIEEEPTWYENNHNGKTLSMFLNIVNIHFSSHPKISELCYQVDNNFNDFLKLYEKCFKVEFEIPKELKKHISLKKYDVELTEAFQGGNDYLTFDFDCNLTFEIKTNYEEATSVIDEFQEKNYDLRWNISVYWNYENNN